MHTYTQYVAAIRELFEAKGYRRLARLLTEDFVTAGGSGAPDDAHYVTTQAEAGLSNEFSLGSLTSGILKQTVSSSVSTPAIATSDIRLGACGFTADGGGATIPTGQVTGFFTCPYAGSISAWSFVLDAGTATVKVWKIATGTAHPTNANSINTSGVSISSGTAVRSTTLSDFTTTTVTANDIFAFNIESLASATNLTFQLEITKTI